MKLVLPSQVLQGRIPRHILPISSGPAPFDERVIDDGAIGQEHIRKGAPVFVFAVSF